MQPICHFYIKHIWRSILKKKFKNIFQFILVKNAFNF